MAAVADQYADNWKPVKTLGGTNGAGSNGSARLLCSTTDGKRHPLAPAIVLFRQLYLAVSLSRAQVTPTAMSYGCSTWS